MSDGVEPFVVNRFAAVPRRLVLLVALALGFAGGCSTPGPEPALAAVGALAAWNDGAAKESILAFVRTVTDASGPDYVRPEERIAVFDNDGTLWCEQPLYVQAVFMIDQAEEVGAKLAEWKDRPSVAALLSGDPKAAADLTERYFGFLMGAMHAGRSTDELSPAAGAWLARARHPRFKQLFTDCVYVPQLELLAYLRANGFKTYVVSGGGVDFMRAFAETAYGVPSEQVIGSVSKTRFEARDGRADLVKVPEPLTFDDKEAKPMNIYAHIGRRPILACGNSDGDLAMLQFTASGPGPRLALVLHHDDAEREYAYDRKSRVGKLDKALDEAAARGWVVVSMKKDFRRVFPFDGD